VIISFVPNFAATNLVVPPYSLAGVDACEQRAKGDEDEPEEWAGLMTGNRHGNQGSRDRVKGHANNESGPALASFYDNVRTHLLGESFDHARSKTGGAFEREVGR
jgi:hypothetical protein